MSFDVLNLSSLQSYARILTAVPAGESITNVLNTLHDLTVYAPDADWMAIQSIQYESYRALVGDAVSLELLGKASPELSALLHAAQVLEEVREGTTCDRPTLEECELNILPRQLLEEWWEGFHSEEEAEELVFDTMGEVVALTRNFPLSVELTQYLITYCLAVELERLPAESYPRKETARCIKLAKYCIPWECCRSVGFLCSVNGEVFLMDGQMDAASCQNYLLAIRQLENCIPLNFLRSYLKERISMPCLNLELEKAVRLWLSAHPAPEPGAM